MTSWRACTERGYGRGALALMPFGYSDTLVPLVGDGDGDGLGVDIQANIFDEVRIVVAGWLTRRRGERGEGALGSKSVPLLCGLRGSA